LGGPDPQQAPQRNAPQRNESVGVMFGAGPKKGKAPSIHPRGQGAASMGGKGPRLGMEGWLVPLTKNETQ